MVSHKGQVVWNWLPLHQWGVVSLGCRGSRCGQRVMWLSALRGESSIIPLSGACGSASRTGCSAGVWGSRRGLLKGLTQLVRDCGSISAHGMGQLEDSTGGFCQWIIFKVTVQVPSTLSCGSSPGWGGLPLATGMRSVFRRQGRQQHVLLETAATRAPPWTPFSLLLALRSTIKAIY